LGHRDIESTMLCMYVENQLFQSASNDDFHVKVVKTSEEIKTCLRLASNMWLKRMDCCFFEKEDDVEN
jgi:hypothetical protein